MFKTKIFPHLRNGYSNKETPHRFRQSTIVRSTPRAQEPRTEEEVRTPDPMERTRGPEEGWEEIFTLPIDLVTNTIDTPDQRSRVQGTTRVSRPDPFSPSFRSGGPVTSPYTQVNPLFDPSCIYSMYCKMSYFRKRSDGIVKTHSHVKRRKQ